MQPELKAWAKEASRALAHLDAERLETLVSSCNALSRDLALVEGKDRAGLTSQAWEAVGDMVVLARVLQATRANLEVMKRLREPNGERLEYSEPRVMGGVGAEGGHGDH